MRHVWRPMASGGGLIRSFSPPECTEKSSSPWLREKPPSEPKLIPDTTLPPTLSYPNGSWSVAPPVAGFKAYNQVVLPSAHGSSFGNKVWKSSILPKVLMPSITISPSLLPLKRRSKYQPNLPLEPPGLPQSTLLEESTRTSRSTPDAALLLLLCVVTSCFCKL